MWPYGKCRSANPVVSVWAPLRALRIALDVRDHLPRPMLLNANRSTDILDHATGMFGDLVVSDSAV